MTQKSPYAMCFDVSLDASVARLEPITMLTKTGEMVAGAPQSKFVLESLLLMHTGRVQSLGFAPNSVTEVLAEWRPKTRGRTHTARLCLKTGLFQSTAPGNDALHGFGLVGLCVALHRKCVSFRTHWIELLTELSATGVQGCRDELFCAVAGDVTANLAAADPMARKGNGWTLEYVNQIDGIEGVTDVSRQLSQVEAFIALVATVAEQNTGDGAVRFQGPQLRTVRSLVRRRKHTVLIGPPGTGKTFCAVEALEREGFAEAGTDYQLFTGHDEVKSADFLGGWQPTHEAGLFRWVTGCLVRAMTAGGGRGQPILVEEFTRMPTRAQNMFISALSDGYVVLNEKPGENGEGEIVKAGPEFVLLADMNVDQGVDDIDMFGAAFSSRVRKVEYGYPSLSALLTILGAEVSGSSRVQRHGVAYMYDAAMKRWQAKELTSPISPRGCIHWLEDIADGMSDRNADDASTLRMVAHDTAVTTWLRDVAGTENALRKTLLSDVEACFRRAGTGK